MADTMHIDTRGLQAALEIAGFATVVASSALLVASVLAWIVIEVAAAWTGGV